LTLEKKIIKIGNSQGIIIPLDILRMYDFELGDTMVFQPEKNKIILKKVALDNDKNKTRKK
jgi:antitoxin component of MazEF toxin-antitoxin module